MQGYLSHAANQFVPDSESGSVQAPLAEAAQTIIALLLSASGDFSETNEVVIGKLVSTFITKLDESASADGSRSHHASSRKLEQTIQVGAQRNLSSTMNLAAGGVDLEATSGRKLESKVDRKKLEKAEKKIKAKQDAKTMRNVEYESSRLLDQPNETQSYEEFFMAVNPLQLGADQSKSKDIKVDNFDVAVNSLRILTEANLTLAYGRRYGLVGQNGIGKSTLLRALSRREVAIPTYISILHVEQEITGDDTPALQAVLDADVWRKHLLAEQDKISRQLAELEAKRASLADRSTDAERLDRERA